VSGARTPASEGFIVLSPNSPDVDFLTASGGESGFEFRFSRRHGLEFLKELLSHDRNLALRRVG
jgi:hypothetical protein